MLDDALDALEADDAARARALLTDLCATMTSGHELEMLASCLLVLTHVILGELDEARRAIERSEASRPSHVWHAVARRIAQSFLRVHELRHAAAGAGDPGAVTRATDEAQALLGAVRFWQDNGGSAPRSFVLTLRYVKEACTV